MRGCKEGGYPDNNEIIKWVCYYGNVSARQDTFQNHIHAEEYPIKHGLDILNLLPYIEE